MDISNINGSHNDSLARLAARRLHKIASSDLTRSLREKVSLAILDYLGAIGSGLQAPWAPQVCRYAQSRPGAPEAHAWGIRDNISAETAAFLNATLAHSAIRDDMHLKSNAHVGSMVISASLALAQRDRWTGEQLLRGIIGGYEMAALLGVAIQQSKDYNRHFRPSGAVGAFGAAAAAVTATSAEEDIAVNALCFAANMASGFNEWAWAGGVEIYTEMGTAAQSAIIAFDIANAGLKCSETILEGRAGLFAALNASSGSALFSEGLEDEIGSGIDAVRFKPVPGCNYAQTLVAVALRVAQNHDLSAGIDGVTVETTSAAKDYPGCDNNGPFSEIQQTKMSIQFGVCAVLLQGSVSEELFTMFDDRELSSLASKCTLQPDENYDRSFGEGRQPAAVEVRLKNGTTVREQLPDVPWLDAEAVRGRFHYEVQQVIKPDDVRRKVMSLVDDLEAVKDCSEIWQLFERAKPLQT